MPTTTTYAYTNAPERYDASYVTTVMANSRVGWRLIKITNQARFTEYQVPRYAAAGYQVFNASDGATVADLEAVIMGEKTAADIKKSVQAGE